MTFHKLLTSVFFEDAPTDGLSFDVVVSQGSATCGQPVVTAPDSDSAATVLSALSRFSVSDLSRYFHVVAADNGGHLHRGHFKSLLLAITGDTVLFSPSTESGVDAVFDSFDTNGDGFVDANEFIAGASVVCGGMPQEKVEAAFALIDEDDDGFISKEELQKYFHSVFTALRQVTPGFSNIAGGFSVEELAAQTTEDCFASADLNSDDRLSIEEFTQWYTGPSSLFPTGMSEADLQPQPLVGSDPADPDMSFTSGGSSDDDGDDDDDSSAASDTSQALLGLDEIRRLTGLGNLSPVEVLTVFKGHHTDPALTQQQFHDVFSTLLKASRHTLPTPLFNKLLAQMFHIFDNDNNGIIDAPELCAGLVTLCGGDPLEKLVMTFGMFDTDGDGEISFAEMVHYLSTVYRLTYPDPADLFAATGVSTHEQLAAITAQQCFKEADLDSSGALSLDEFQAWFQRPAALGETAVVTAGASPPGLTLETVRDLTGLSSMSLDTICRVFATATGPSGRLSSSAFSRVMRRLVHSRNPFGLPTAVNRRLAGFLADLFNTFDLDGDGSVDARELSVGMSVLCGGSPRDKAEAAFAAFDANSDGHIDREEMTHYVSTILRVTNLMSHTTANAEIDELAAATVDQCFLECDTDSDGRLDFDEFVAWFSATTTAPSPTAATVFMSPAADEVGADMLGHTRALLGLQGYTPAEVFSAVANAADESGQLSRQAFGSVFASFYDVAREEDWRAGRLPNSSSGEPRELGELLSRLFDVFDSDGDGKISFTELASGLAVLCGGHGDDRVGASFALYDLDGDGYITPEEMETYLTSVFKVMMTSAPQLREQLGGVTPEVLARDTTVDAFAAADVDRDGKLSLLEFQRWFMSRPTAPAPTPSGDGANATPFAPPVAAPPPEGGPPAVAPPSRASDRPLQSLSLSQARSVTGLGNVSLADVAKVFLWNADDHGRLTPQAFQMSFSHFIRHSPESYAAAAPVLPALFDLFPQDSNGTVSVRDVLAGVSTLCKPSSVSDKAAVAFRLYDKDGDGFIQREEMVSYLVSVFTVMHEAEPDMFPATMGPTELALFTTDECFSRADSDGDGKLSMQEFTSWLASGGNASPTGVGASVRATVLHTRTDPPEWVPLAEVRRVTGLGSVPVNQVFDVFAGYANSDGDLDLSAFQHAFQRFIPADALENPSRFDEVLKLLFHAFDKDDNGVVDFTELSTGLAVLCAGSHGDKAAAAFSLYDVDNSGYIDKAEMCTYLTSVFRVMFATGSAVPSMTPEELAAVTVDACFEQADTDGDGKLSFDEFRAWALSSEGTDLADAVVTSASAPPAALTLSEVQSLTGLGSADIREVYRIFASACSDDGYLSQAAFAETMRGFMRADASSLEQERVSLMVEHLFAVFDADGNGLVDFAELAAGLSVLCGGSGVERARAAFELYDTNGDGVLSVEELQSYLEGVFKVMVAAGHGDGPGMSASDIAAATARTCIEEADLDGDGCLTFTEFLQWYLGSDNADEGLKELVVTGPTAVQVAATTGVDAAQAGAGAGAGAGASGDTAGLTTAEFARLSGLSEQPAAVVLKTFVGLCDAHGNLGPDDFHAAFRTFAGDLSAADLDQLDEAVAALFDAFDADNNDQVDLCELAAGLAMLCAGDQDEKLRASLSLYDLDGNEILDLEELSLFLESVLKVRIHGDEAMAERLRGVSAQQLAVVTADRVLSSLGKAADGSITFDEFSSWCAASTSSGSVMDFSPELVTLEELRTLTNLSARSVAEVSEAFLKHADPDTEEMDLPTFRACFSDFLADSTSADTPAAATLREAVLNRLFSVFDVNGDGVVSVEEVSAGMAMLCGGSPHEKAKAVFMQYDRDGNDGLSLSEMTMYLTSVFRIVYEANPDTEEQVGLSADELAEVTAMSCFSKAGKTDTDELTFEEFKQWYSSSDLGAIASPSAGGGAQSSSERSGLSPPALRRLTTLSETPPAEVVASFQRAAAADGVLDKAGFTAAFQPYLSSPAGDADASHSQTDIMNALFALFDSNGDGKVDFTELACGLSVLCGGNADDKMKCIFDLYDKDGDGFISKDEMLTYLTTTFKVLFEVNQDYAVYAGETPAAIAEATATQCFEESDLDGDGRLSLPEFKSWFTRNSS